MSEIESLEAKFDKLAEMVQEKTSQTQANVNELRIGFQEIITLLKGYNGYKGMAAVVESHSDSIITINSFIEPLKGLVPEVATLKTAVKALQERPGNTALKWINRIGVALISAAAVSAFTLWISEKSVAQVKVVNQPAPTEFIRPNATQDNITHPTTQPSSKD